MQIRYYSRWPILAVYLFIIFLFVSNSKTGRDVEDSTLQHILQRKYPTLTEESACQLCAVALESKNHRHKADQFCVNNQGAVRSCGLISFTYLLTSYKFPQAFDLEYQIFYREPFGHEQKISVILSKQHVRNTLISWLEQNASKEERQILLSKSIANLYLDNMNKSLNNLESYLLIKDGLLDKRTIKLKNRIYEKQGKFNEALNMISNYLRQTEKESKPEPYLYHLKGNLLMHHLKFQPAIREFQKATNLFKNTYQEVEFIRGFVFSEYNIGICYQKMSNYEQAIKQYSRIIQNNIKNAQVLNALGNSYMEFALKNKNSDENFGSKDLSKSIFYLSRAIEANPEYYPAHYNLGYAYMKNNQLDKAIQKFQDSLNIKKNYQAEFALLTAYFLSQRFIEAEQFVYQNMSISKQSIDDLLSVYYQYGNEKKNRKFYHKIITENENLIKSANGHYWKGMIEFEIENYGLAIDHFLQAYDKGYSEPHLLFNLAYAYQLILDYKNALQYYQKAYKKDPRLETKDKINQCKSRISSQSEMSDL